MTKPRVVIVGAGFAGYHAAKTLSRLAGSRAEIVLLNTTDYFLYLPLLPEVAAGVVEPTRIAVPLAGTLDGVRVVIGEADRVDMQNRWVGYRSPRATTASSRTTGWCSPSAASTSCCPSPG